VAGSVDPVGYEVRTDVFEGPFDVLFRLITEQRVDLYEVPLADIVDAFLNEVEALQCLDLEVATEFLVIAATLVELKCRRLLPGRQEPDEEGLALLEERDYLLARLVECTTFSAAGARLCALELAASRSWPRLAGPDERFDDLQPDLLSMFSPQELRLAALRALETLPVVHVQTDHVLVDEVTVSDVVEALCAILPSSGPTTFKALTANARSRMEVVVHFLGLLELYKRGFVELDQATTFGELRVSWSAPGSEALIRSGDGDSLRSDGSVPQVPVMSLAELEYRG